MEQFRKYGIPPFRIALLHGGPGAAGEMAPVARKLSESSGVLEPLQRAPSIQGQIEELRGCLEDSADCPVTLTGFSWGAWLAMLFAEAHPSQVKKIILVGCPPFEQHYAAAINDTRFARLAEAERREAQSLMVEVERDSAGANRRALLRLGDLFAAADAVERVEMESVSVEFDAAVFHAVWREAEELRRSGNLLVRVSKIRTPVVAIHGDADPHPGDGVRVPLSRNLADFRFICLAGCGHRPWEERRSRDEFHRLLQLETASVP